MKPFLLAIAIVLSESVSFAQQASPATPSSASDEKLPICTPIKSARPLKLLQKAPLYSFCEKELDVYLKYLHESEPDPIKRLIHLARKNIGEPYEIYLLGEYPYEMYDPDPMYCLNKSDCVTFVEHTYAEALSSDWPGFFKTLQRLRYKTGQVGMLTRNHESVADWDPNNAWLFDNITTKLGDGNQHVPLHLTWKPSKFFSKFGIGQDMPDVTVTDAYIPRDKVAGILKDLKEGDVVHVVRGNSKEQYVGHFGLVALAPDGTINMIHSAEPAVREQGLLDYLEKNPKTLGYKFLRPKAEPEKLVAAAR